MLDKKILKYEDYKKALKEKSIQDLFKLTDTVADYTFIYPSGINERDGFFVFKFNFIQKTIFTFLSNKYNLNMTDLLSSTDFYTDSKGIYFKKNLIIKKDNINKEDKIIEKYKFL